MSKPAQRPYSGYSQEALSLFGQAIKQARIDRKMTSAELAARAGVSRMLLHRLERGHPGTSIGAAFEVATVAGLRLFEAEPDRLSTKLARVEQSLTLLPKAVRAKAKLVRDDF